MCGIVGAAARRDIVPVLVEGLRRLEYRGYDSCGVAALGENGLERVHNGIIENYEARRAELQAQGYQFESQTDTEVVTHLVHSLYDGDLFQAVRRAVKRLTGAYAIAVVAADQPHRVVGARAGSPLVVGVGAGEMFLASDALALAGTTERIAYLEEGDVAEIRLDGYRVLDQADRPGKREARLVKAGRR